MEGRKGRYSPGFMGGFVNEVSELPFGAGCKNGPRGGWVCMGGCVWVCVYVYVVGLFGALIIDSQKNDNGTEYNSKNKYILHRYTPHKTL